MGKRKIDVIEGIFQFHENTNQKLLFPLKVMEIRIISLYS